MSKPRKPSGRGKVVRVRRAGPAHAVVSVRAARKKDEAYRYRREPCAECPWRKDAPVGAFPAEAFRISADTAYDQSDRAFSCHMSGAEKAATCAGFLLRGATHNLGIRMRYAFGDIEPGSVTSDVPLYRSYREMAEANGVDPDDPKLARCR